MNDNSNYGPALEAGDLLVLGGDMGRDEAAQPEGVALGVGEGGALVEQWIVKQVDAALAVQVQ